MRKLRVHRRDFCFYSIAFLLILAIIALTFSRKFATVTIPRTATLLRSDDLSRSEGTKPNDDARINNVGLDAEQKVTTASVDGSTSARADGVWLPKDSDKKPVNVYVVEEHHEVIPYWFQSVYNGITPKSDNVLVHIDGHSDLFSVELVPGYPLFSMPTEDQLHFLMQRNDGFIQASAMAGLVARVIWVWPTWDVERQDQHGALYLSYQMHLGWMDVSQETNTKADKAFCSCNDEKVCFTTTEINSTAINNVFFLVPIDRCHIMKTISIEEISESRALSYFKSDWNPKHKPVLLDVDEDFYGCSYAIRPALDAKIDSSILTKIEEGLGTFFCPQNNREEEDTNKLLATVLINITYNHCKAVTDSCFQKLIRDFTQTIREMEREKKISLCNKSFYKRFVDRFITLVAELSNEQIFALIEISFCANTTPKTFDINNYRKFGLCSGANSPNHSMVLEHMPSKIEVDTRTEVIKRIFKYIRNEPISLITIARSIRDGYTPRAYFEQIERDIILNLKEIIDPTLNVIYDEDLLGGKEGVVKRTKRLRV